MSQVALGKEGGFAECCQEDTRQRYLRCRVSPLTLGKAAVSVTRRRNGRFSLPSAPWHSANLFAECPRKSTRQRRLCRCTVCRAFFAECYTRQSLCRVFLRLRRVLPALGEAIDSGSGLCRLSAVRIMLYNMVHAKKRHFGSILAFQIGEILILQKFVVN